MNSFEEVYEAVKAYCSEHGVGDLAIDIWLNKLEPARLEGSVAVFYCPSVFHKGIIMKNYNKILCEAFEQTVGFPVELKLVVTDDTPAEPEEIRSEDFDAVAADLDDAEDNSNYPYTFETFIVGSSNRFAYAACTSVARGDNADNTYNPLFIYGDSGLGKTHLIHAIAHEMKKRDPNLNIIYVTGETFTNELIEAIQQKEQPKFHAKYRNADVLLVDDVQFISGRESTQEEFFHTFNILHNARKQIVLTSDRPPKDIKILEERIRSRFESGLITDVALPDFETRVAIVRRKAELLDLQIPDEVAEFIANHLKSNIRQLEGAVKRLLALKQLAGSPPSITMAQTVIRDILTDEQPTPVTVEHVIAEVANVYGVTPEDMRSKKRSQQISNARKIAIYIVKEITQMSLAAIGEEFAGRDHSTIVYSIQDVEAHMKKDAQMRETIETIMKTIREGFGK